MTSPRVAAVLGEVKAEMARRDLRLMDLDVGMSPATLSRTFNGHRECTLAELLTICDALNVSFGELVRRAEHHGAVA